MTPKENKYDETLHVHRKQHCKIIVKLCKYPVVYLDGKTRVENNKSKFKKKQIKKK